MSVTERAPLRFPAAEPDHRSAESLRFEQLRREICGHKPFLPLRAILSGGFGEFLPSISVVEPSLTEMKLPILMTGERLAELSMGKLPEDYLEIVREDMRPFAYRTSIEMIDRPCGLWERLTAGLTDSSRYGFEITGFPVVDEESKVRQLAFLVRFVSSPEPLRHLAGVVEGVEGRWLDLGCGVSAEGPIGFL